MLTYYPDFKKERLEHPVLLGELSAQERSILAQFVEYCAITAGQKKCADMRSLILQIRHIVGKDLSSWELPDVRQFLALLNRSGKRDWTQHGIKLALKRFIKWHYPDWSSRFRNLDDVRLKKVSTQDRYTESHLLTKDDVERLLRSAETLREKAMIMLLFETACRPHELCRLRWQDVRLGQSPPIIVLYSSKTRQARTFPLNSAVLHLKRWREEWRYPDREEQDRPRQRS